MRAVVEAPWWVWVVLLLCVWAILISRDADDVDGGAD